MPSSKFILQTSRTIHKQLFLIEKLLINTLNGCIMANLESSSNTYIKTRSASKRYGSLSHCTLRSSNFGEINYMNSYRILPDNKSITQMHMLQLIQSFQLLQKFLEFFFDDHSHRFPKHIFFRIYNNQ